MPWTLKRSYTGIAPFYDWVVARAFHDARVRSLRALPANGHHVLINGIGTGLDLPNLPRGNHYVGLDITHAMLTRARRRAGDFPIQWLEGDSMQLPFRDGAFDYALLHLILAVVPDSVQCLREAARVIKSGGRLIVLDKFLRPGERATLRRAFNGIARRIATRLDVVFEDVLAACPQLRKVNDQPAMMGGWFRHIVLEKI